jgi:uncharacterized membrane protein YedE/YeeE
MKVRILGVLAGVFIFGALIVANSIEPSYVPVRCPAGESCDPLGPPPDKRSGLRSTVLIGGLMIGTGFLIAAFRERELTERRSREVPDPRLEID